MWRGTKFKKKVEVEKKENYEFFIPACEFPDFSHYQKYSITHIAFYIRKRSFVIPLKTDSSTSRYIVHCNYCYRLPFLALAREMYFWHSQIMPLLGFLTLLAQGPWRTLPNSPSHHMRTFPVRQSTIMRFGTYRIRRSFITLESACAWKVIWGHLSLEL